jgi:hypothetical protein
MKKFGLDLSQKGSLIMNGHSQNGKGPGHSAGSCEKRTPSRKVGYFGFIDDCPGYRDLRVLLSYADACGFVVSRSFEFHFFGEVRLFNTDIRKFKNIFIHEPIAYDEVHEAMREMDFLLIYHTERNDAAEVITGKVFDYMVVKRPIICMGPLDMEVIRIIENNGIGFGVDYMDRKAIEGKFDRLWWNNFKYNYGFDFMEHSREKEYLKLAKIIEDSGRVPRP